MIPPDGDGMYRQFLDDARAVNPNLRVIGCTATPYRLKSGSICTPEGILNHVCYEVGVRELIVRGYLCPLVSKAGKVKADTSGLHVRAGEFVPGEVARSWADFRPGASGNLADWHPVPHRVPQTPDAEAVFRCVRERADAEYARAEAQNDPAGMAIWARAYEKARRLALLYAVSVCRDNPVVTPEAATWAGAFVEHQTRRMLYMAQHFASESEFDARMQLHEPKPQAVVH